MIAANGAILENENEQAIEAITGLAETVFNIMPFAPDPFRDNWRDVLRCWLMGQPLAEVVADNPSEVLRFVENGLIYKLPWGIEAIKVRAQANGDTIGDDGIFTIDDFETGLSVPAIETGTRNRRAAILMQAGFTARLAAIKAVNDTGANFENAADMRAWMDSEAVVELGQDAEWPTPERHKLWLDFTTSYVPLAEYLEYAICNFRSCVAQPRRRACDWGGCKTCRSWRQSSDPFCQDGKDWSTCRAAHHDVARHNHSASRAGQPIP